MKKISLNDNSKIYVMCPAYEKTGGPELLHQLVNVLNTQKKYARIVYYNVKKENKNYRPSAFDQYTTEYLLSEKIEDDEENVLIFPEVIEAIKLTKNFKKIRKAMWWLSVDNFKRTCGLKNSIKNFGYLRTIKKVLNGNLLYSIKSLKKMDYHLCQSYYAIDFLKENEMNNIIYLSDYINDTFLNNNSIDIVKKNNVLYNPKKGYEFTKKIIENAKDINWIPLINLTTEQVRDLLSESKVYIDFGNHPGKDRFPREAAMSGCCVITGKRGSANFDKDVPILAEYKFDDEIEKIDEIILKIRKCLDDYQDEIVNFKKYKEFILSERQSFYDDVKKIFN